MSRWAHAATGEPKTTNRSIHLVEPPLSETAYLPGEAYDEMFAPGGITRANYRLLDQDIQALGAQALADRQKTQERSFLL